MKNNVLDSHKNSNENTSTTDQKKNGKIEKSGCPQNGPFIVPQIIEKSSNGTSFVEVSPIGTATYIRLKDTLTQQIIYETTIQQGSSSTWGYSPDDQIFFLSYINNPTGSDIIGYVDIVVPKLPRHGAHSYPFHLGASWGFGPDGLAFLLATNHDVTVYQSESGTPLTTGDLIDTWGEWKFNPCGDIFVLIGKNNFDPVKFYKMDLQSSRGQIWNTTSDGHPVSITVDLRRGAPFLEIIHEGKKGIKLTGMSLDFIDNI